MRRYAIALVILPPEPVMDLAIAWNAQLSGLERQSIHLNKSNTLPHISLLMGCLSEEALPRAIEDLEHTVQSRQALSLQVTGLQFTTDSHPVAALDITRSPELSQLQHDLIEALRPCITQDAGEKDMFDPPPVSPSSIEWINHFMPDQCGEQLWPHVTLGHGRADLRQNAFHFMATRMAICHLGNHCTCRNILAEVSLAG